MIINTLTEKQIDNTTSSLIDQLENLEEIDGYDEKNRTACRLLNLQLREFFDDIYIPFNLFRENSWNISKILYNNEDSLFYNKKYLTDEDEERFHQIFSKYITMIEENFNPDNKLQLYLKNWTDTNNSKWKTNDKKSYLKSILTKRKYQIISPSYTTDIYTQYIQKYGDDRKKFREKFEHHLDTIISEFKDEYKKFQAIYNEIVNSYVYEYPLDYNPHYVMGFINSIILAILDFVEKLVELNIYAIHPILVHFIEYYTPLDEINHYLPSENNGRRLCIV